jgi:anti-anti-sigma factor
MDIVTDGSTLLISGLLDARSVGELRMAVYDHLEAHPEHVVLDMSGVESVDLTTLKMLAVASRMANRAGHRVTVRGCPGSIRRLLHLARLRALVTVEDEPSGALAGVGHRTA